MSLLNLRNIKKKFGNNLVLKGIDLEIDLGDVIALIGSSGSGKSTLLRVINLLEQIDDGQIFLDGEDISDPRVNPDIVRSKMGIVFQNFNLFPHLSVLANVTLALRVVRKIPRRDAEQKGMQLLERIQLTEKANVYPDQLSGGQQQRVAIVRAIAHNPKLLLLDEITSALDPRLVGEVLDLVVELKSSDTTIIIATHEMSFAKHASDKVVFLKDGIVEEQGTPSQIFGNPTKAATVEFLR
ncbi:MAG: amino acid ABC transporter ATP-binding protein [Clostridiales bacterium]|jgi:polar amino acid transport system ATP-binding protein|nr:amino acid ABC transporter ATP-binding protein [Clostridiales bacterium]